MPDDVLVDPGHVPSLFSSSRRSSVSSLQCKKRPSLVEVENPIFCRTPERRLSSIQLAHTPILRSHNSDYHVTNQQTHTSNDLIPANHFSKRLHLDTTAASLISLALQDAVNHNDRLHRPPYTPYPAPSAAGCFRSALDLEIDRPTQAITSLPPASTISRDAETQAPITQKDPRLVLKRQKTFDDSSAFAPRCDCIIPIWCKEYPDENLLRHLASDVQNGLRANLEPAMTEWSTGGTYYMRNAIGRIAAVFKPSDEEPYGPNNPRDYRGTELGMKNGIPSGEAAVREAAAFIIDDNFARVPPTTLVQVMSLRLGHTEKEGSLQHYVRHLGSSDDFGPSRFNFTDAHRIMVLDIRLLNQDRHNGNVLVRSHDMSAGVFGELSSNLTDELSLADRGDSDPGCPSTPSSTSSNRSSHTSDLPPDNPPSIRRCHSVGPALEGMPQRSRSTSNHRRNALCHKIAERTLKSKIGKRGGEGENAMRLIPIDHGFCLPHPLMIDETEYCWMHWPQAKQPFSRDVQDYVHALDPQEDINRLKATLGSNLPAHCLLTLRIGTELLKEGVKSGLTPYEIALMIVRETPDRPSKLEVIIDETYHAILLQPAFTDLLTPRRNPTRATFNFDLASPALTFTPLTRNRCPPVSTSPRSSSAPAASPPTVNSRVESASRRLLSSERTHSYFMELLKPKLASLCGATRDRRILRAASS